MIDGLRFRTSEGDYLGNEVMLQILEEIVSEIKYSEDDKNW